ncbi:unnamed protein product [Leptosia nina]|uniref:TAP-C domain-containing protein n=1 Tax=Leptosia nina TaxID=320188 RepID=A0AAV1J2B3_9NEOP
MTHAAAKYVFLFQVNNKSLSFKFDLPLDDETRKSITDIFTKLTGLNVEQSVRCLEEKEWDLKLALEYFMKLLKLDNFECIRS